MLYVCPAKKKNNDITVWEKCLKKTGNKPAPPPPPALTAAERAVFMLLGDSPSFKGIVGESAESDVLIGSQQLEMGKESNTLMN